MGMGFQFEQHRLGLWDLSWDFKKKFPGKWDKDTPLTTLLQRVIAYELRP